MLISLVVDHNTADVVTRERFHLCRARVEALYAGLCADGIPEMVVLNTCNRTELYASCPDAAAGDIQRVSRLLAERWTLSATDAAALLAVATVRIGIDAARHALRVAAGLESQVLGDAQILGQLRRAHTAARDAGACGAVLHRLFETALRAGKRVQAGTALGSGASSVASRAAALAMQGHSVATDARIAVVGCGKTGALAVRQLMKMGARNVVLLNRSPERALELAQDLSVRAAPLTALYHELAQAEVALVATGAALPIVCAGQLASARRQVARTQAPLLLIDLAMPRNIESECGTLPGVTLVDLGALHPATSAAECARRAAIPAAEKIVEAELAQFGEWLANACARDAIRPLYETLAEACLRELSHTIASEDAERLSRRIVAKVMAVPMHAFRETLARGEPVADLARSMQLLFSRGEALPAAVAAGWTPELTKDHSAHSSKLGA